MSAPASDSNPATNQTVKALPGVPTLQVITRALRNTPVPMTLATLTEIAAIRPSPRISSVCFEVSGFKFQLSVDYSGEATNSRCAWQIL